MSSVIVNLFGGPGVGKTSLGSDIFAQLKKKHISVELVPEVAKQMIYQSNQAAIKYQFFIGNTQLFWQKSVEDHVDVVIAESPYILSSVYNQTHPHLTSGFIEEFKKQNNINYFILRKNNAFDVSGRIHSFEESKSLDKEILNMLKSNSIDFREIELNQYTVEEILKDIFERNIK